MTLHAFPDVEQGTQTWHDLRRGIVTASTIGKLLTPTLKVADNDQSRGLTLTLAAERIAGWSEDSPTTWDMVRGIESEPYARDIYSSYYHHAEEFGFMLWDHDGWSLGYSPDGIVGEDGLLEVKAPRAKTHVQTILADEVPAFYMPQLQAGLYVSGRDWIDFCSYVSGLPLYVKRVTPDRKWFDAIRDACIQFEKNVSALVADYEARVQNLPKTERIDLNNLGLVF